MVEDYQANYQSGWIKLYRSIKNHWLWDNPNYLKWWIAILIEVNHTGQKFALGYKLIDVNQGQSCKSLRQWSDLFGCNVKTAMKFFDLLEEDKMIRRKTVGKGKQSTTLVSVEKYAQYQAPTGTLNGTLNGTLTERKVNAKGTQDGYKQEAKNDKNEKNEKKIEQPAFVSDFKPPITKDGTLIKADNDALRKFYDYRDDLKVPLEEALKVLEPIYVKKRFSDIEHFNNWFLQTASESRSIAGKVKFVQ